MTDMQSIQSRVFQGKLSQGKLSRVCGFLALVLILANFARADSPDRALILDGQNNHADWPKTTMMMKHYLENQGGFEVDIARTKYVWNGDKWLDQYPLNDGRNYISVSQPRADENFAPEFSKYQVVISNLGFGAAAWPKATQSNLQQFIHDGGGLVIVHAANNSFGNWREFNEMIGLGGWGGRNEQSGPYVFVDDAGTIVRDEQAGSGGGHGPQHEFEIVSRQPDHPVMAGLPTKWLHAKDELYHKLRGPAKNMKILATAFSAKKYNGTARHEPMIMTIDYGKGRVFHTPMGHADYSMECVGFITVFVRGAQWAASGKVTYVTVPDDFPHADKTSSRKFK